MTTPAPVAPGDLDAAGSRPVALVVEDDDDVAALLASHLRRLEWVCHRAATGEDGVALALVLGPQLALVDICLPGMDGREVVRQLRRRAETSGCVVVVTTVLEGEDLQDVDFDDLLPKPFSRRDVERLLAGVPRRSRRPDPVSATGAPVPLPRSSTPPAARP
ncbi:response regulator [uncultured Pseudokineococcus sp.]|uniref:response regulator n=1 Tax=uncultured Pseudokineococcus sp. TaxID=1642928 RepID=UPI002610A098|nr:response regulator [uncultured Pseudokineococcus sp.]